MWRCELPTNVTMTPEAHSTTWYTSSNSFCWSFATWLKKEVSARPRLRRQIHTNMWNMYQNVSNIARLSCFKGNGCRYTGVIYIEYTHIEVLSSFGIVVGPCTSIRTKCPSIGMKYLPFWSPTSKCKMHTYLHNESDCCQLSKKLMLLSVLWSTIARCYVHKYVNLQAPRQTWTCSNDTWGIKCHNDMTVRNNPNVRCTCARAIFCVDCKKNRCWYVCMIGF